MSGDAEQGSKDTQSAEADGAKTDVPPLSQMFDEDPWNNVCL